ncbi:MAG: PspC domain-containing protein [Woeseiaceae bacterium]|nr:PspC domain-containing protein [Woeseiaceae bacterium]
MSYCAGVEGRRLYRDSDRAVLGGVCAGLSHYLGINLKVTRFLCIIAFLCAFPFALIAYLAAVLLIPASSSKIYDEEIREEILRDELRKDRLREEILRAKPTVGEVRKRYEDMDSRLAKIEKYVTSSQYELDQKLRRL